MFNGPDDLTKEQRRVSEVFVKSTLDGEINTSDMIKQFRVFCVISCTSS